VELSVPAGRLKYSIASWCIPDCSAWSSALFDASKRKAGAPAAAPTGSPQAISTLAM
jgi:hypothetical protein